MSAQLQLLAPSSYRAEREYIYRVLLEDYLGLSIDLAFGERDDVCIRLMGDAREPAPELRIDDGLFALPRSAWLSRESLPPATLPFASVPSWLQLDVALPELPIMFSGRAPGEPIVLRDDPGLRLRFDPFGCAFFMLSRYEEAVPGPRDTHGRFAAADSLAVRAGFVERPIVDEYTELLWACLRALWPDLSRARRTFALRPTHDVDVPLEYGFRSVPQFARQLLGSLAYRKRGLIAAARAALDYARVRRGALERDPAFTFDRIMSWSEQHGVQSAFYFLCDPSERAMGARYSIDHPIMRDLLARIHARGHTIGVHASYRSVGDAVQLARELDTLRSLCASLGIEQTEWGVRHHYLRWATPDSFRALDGAGFAHDSTLSFADRAGFRSGTCREHRTFDLRTGSALRLRERPLIVMECTVMDPVYMGLGKGEAAFACMQRLLEQCRKFDGEFVCLWHNNRLANAEEVSLYLALLDAAAG